MLLAASAVLLGVFDVLLIPLYLGSTPVPVAVVLGVAQNLLLPRFAYSLVRSVPAAALPVAAWLLPVLGLSLYSRPEGDVLVLGGGAQQWTLYGVVVLGLAAGFRSVVKVTAPLNR